MHSVYTVKAASRTDVPPSVQRVDLGCLDQKISNMHEFPVKSFSPRARRNEIYSSLRFSMPAQKRSHIFQDRGFELLGTGTAPAILLRRKSNKSSRKDQEKSYGAEYGPATDGPIELAETLLS
ncbi:hypothetical protein CEXT_545301 [Caerostris extrusa]|uniref:Uncharacterized protein n=1 Tax=Caerostris extrusa TaxID=172846 RepID=A0AAV4M9V7_CAEEX|nr:hypothetical protein CEXT_545301 [Caerostris extrusa]